MAGATVETSGTKPVFSVIVPTYNRASLVANAIRSVLRQTFDAYEIIVVDDGSTDNTRDLLPVSDRVRYVYQENAGAAAARNRGALEARGEFLAFLDSDDLFEPRMLEAVLRTFEHYPEVGCVFTAEREIGPDGESIGPTFTKKSRGLFFSSASLIDRDTRVGSGRPGAVRRHWVDRLGGFDETLGCAIDSDLWIRYSFHMPMVLQPEPLVLRGVPESCLSRDIEQDGRDWIRILDKVARQHPEFVRQNERIYRKALSKNYKKYGRSLLAKVRSDPTVLGEARRALRQSCRLQWRPSRAHLYLSWSYVAASTYGRFRRLELDYFPRTRRRSNPRRTMIRRPSL